MVGSTLCCFLKVVEGASLLRSGLNDLFNALHWQVDETARLLTTYASWPSTGAVAARLIDWHGGASNSMPNFPPNSAILGVIGV
jgi:hypothetical protein